MRELADLGVTGLRLTVPEANAPARKLYEATGGAEAGRITIEEDGSVLSAIVFEWPDVSAVASP